MMEITFECLQVSLPVEQLYKIDTIGVFLVFLVGKHLGKVAGPLGKQHLPTGGIPSS